MQLLLHSFFQTPKILDNLLQNLMQLIFFSFLKQPTKAIIIYITQGTSIRLLMHSESVSHGIPRQ